MSCKTLFALVCLFCLCTAIPTDVQACQVWNVPGDVSSVVEAIDLAQPGDIIQIAIGRHKVVGREIQLKPGLLIRGGAGLPGTCILEESTAHADDWRNRPVFELVTAGEPCRFEGITFANFNLSCGPDEYACNPIFHVGDGIIEFDNCQWRNYYKQALHFDGGIGRFTDCEFSKGVGCPSAINFSGERLELTDCVFRDNAWVYNCEQYRGRVLALSGGVTVMEGCEFVENGPVEHVLTVGSQARLTACHTCFVDNAAMWEARVEGHVTLDCCVFVPHMWHVVDGGQLNVIGPTTAAKSRPSTDVTWSRVKSLFQ